MQHPLRTLFVAGLVAAATLTSAGVAVGATAAAPTGRPAIHVRTTKKHHVEAPKTVRPGIAHFRSDSSGFNLLVVVEAKHGTGNVAEVARGLNANKADVLLEHYRVIGFLESDKGFYAKLSRGTYYIADADLDSDKIKASNISTMTATGSPVDARVPAAKDVVVSSHKSLHTPRTLARSGWLHLQNRSAAFSGLLFWGVATKTTYAQLKDLVQHPSFRKLSKVISDGKGGVDVLPFTAEMGPHSSSWVPMKARPGRYVATLFVVKDDSSMPTLHRGQVRVVTVR